MLYISDIREIAQLVEHALWEREVAGSSPVFPISQGGYMERHERGDLSGWAFLFIVMVFLAFVIYNRPKEVSGLEGGNIEKAIQKEQYR